MRTTYIRVTVGIALIAVGFAAGIFINLSFAHDESEELQAAHERIEVLNEAVSRSEDRLWILYREREALQVQVEAAANPSLDGPDATSSTPDVFGDGVWIVEEDIAPGEYDGEVVNEYGYWARLERTDGTVYAIIQNGVERGPFVLEIIPSDKAVELKGVVLTPR